MAGRYCIRVLDPPSALTKLFIQCPYFFKGTVKDLVLIWGRLGLEANRVRLIVLIFHLALVPHLLRGLFDRLSLTLPRTDVGLIFLLLLLNHHSTLERLFRQHQIVNFWAFNYQGLGICVFQDTLPFLGGLTIQALGTAESVASLRRPCVHPLEGSLALFGGNVHVGQYGTIGLVNRQVNMLMSVDDSAPYSFELSPHALL